jgi:hypothetical protein
MRPHSLESKRERYIWFKTKTQQLHTQCHWPNELPLHNIDTAIALVKS